MGSDADDGPGEHLSYDAALARLTAAMAQMAVDKVDARIPQVLDRLNIGGVPVIVLKGPVTRLRLYDADEKRPTADIDLLVEPASFRNASRLLAAQGYRRTDRHGHSDTLQRHDDDIDIDLHLTLPYVTVRPRRAYAVLAAHTTSLTVADSRIPVLDEPAHVVHLAIHAAVNRFDPASRTVTEWQRGIASLDASQLTTAEGIAHALGVEPIWNLACRANTDPASRTELAAELPMREVEPRMRSVRRLVSSGVPLTVRWRDAQRMIDLQLGDDAVNKWRADRNEKPLEPGSLSIRLRKIHRLVAVSFQGLRRILNRSITTDSPR